MFVSKIRSRIFNPMYTPIARSRYTKIYKKEKSAVIIPFHHLLLSPPSLKTLGRKDVSNRLNECLSRPFRKTLTSKRTV